VPATEGTHAYVLGPCVRDLRLLKLETAVAKMTGVAARALGLRDRGLLRPGAWADVAVFDPARVVDRSTYEVLRRQAAAA
jgi:N-acyl-D-amino-acid deacylase